MTNSRFLVDNQIGEGAYGTVYKAIDQQMGNQCVVKKISMVGSELNPKYLNEEVGILQKLKHPNIANCIQVYLEPKTVCIAMEFVDGGDLRDYLNIIQVPLTETEVISMFLQLAYGIQYCHKHDVLHRDLKPENVLLTKDRQVKICDFGLSKSLGQQSKRATSTIGTINYMAPEIIVSARYSFPVDVWALGCCVYEMMALRRAFEGVTFMEVGQKICQWDPDQIDGSYSQELKDLVMDMLDRDEETRIPLDEVINKLINIAASDSLSNVVSRDAIYKVACILAKGEIHDQSMPLFKQGYDEGHVPSIVKYGICLEKGYAVEKNVEEAMECYKKGVDAGIFEAMNAYANGILHGYLGHRSAADIAQAMKFSKQAADSGDPELALSYAKDLEKGSFGLPDKKAAMAYYKKSAGKGNVEAIFLYGNALEEGYDGAPNHKNALKQYREAADKGHPKACFKYALGIAKGYTKKKAAKQLIPKYVERAILLGDQEALQFVEEHEAREKDCSIS